MDGGGADLGGARAGAARTSAGRARLRHRRRAVGVHLRPRPRGRRRRTGRGAHRPHRRQPLPHRGPARGARGPDAARRRAGRHRPAGVTGRARRGGRRHLGHGPRRPRVRGRDGLLLAGLRPAPDRRARLHARARRARADRALQPRGGRQRVLLAGRGDHPHGRRLLGDQRERGRHDPAARVRPRAARRAGPRAVHRGGRGLPRGLRRPLRLPGVPGAALRRPPLLGPALVLLRRALLPPAGRGCRLPRRPPARASRRRVPHDRGRLRVLRRAAGGRRPGRRGLPRHRRVRRRARPRPRHPPDGQRLPHAGQRPARRGGGLRDGQRGGRGRCGRRAPHRHPHRPRPS